MSRIREKFLQPRTRPLFIAFVTAGDPSLEMTRQIVLELETAGADIIELGIPFSDPMADGPSIQASSTRALRGGVTPPQVLDLVREIRQESQIPLILMTYYNPVLQWGLEKFAQSARSAGVDGVIITDLTPEEAVPWKRVAEKEGLDTIFLLAPTSTEERMARVTQLASGFIYCVSRTGVTGAREDLASEELRQLVQRIRQYTSLPIAVGFGISRPEHLRILGQWVEGVVVGSALVDVIASHLGDPRLPARVAQKVRLLLGDEG